MTEGVDGLHLIGHSMGAHIVGFTGKNLGYEKIPRITGNSNGIYCTGCFYEGFIYSY